MSIFKFIGNIMPYVAMIMAIVFLALHYNFLAVFFAGFAATLYLLRLIRIFRQEDAINKEIRDMKIKEIEKKYKVKK